MDFLKTKKSSHPNCTAFPSVLCCFLEYEWVPLQDTEMLSVPVQLHSIGSSRRTQLKKNKREFGCFATAWMFLLTLPATALTLEFGFFW